MEENKRKVLQDALSKIQKKFGKESINLLSEANIPDINKISTGSLKIDDALGGGVAEGRVIEVYGPESSGKTTLALHIAAETQKKGGIVAFIDVENALDIDYAASLGVNIDDLVVSQPDYGEQAIEMAETLVNSGVVDLVIVDSVAALTPKAELEGEMTDQTVGLLARIMSKGLRKMTAIANQNQCTLLFINQIRDKIGGMGYGPQTTTTGGHALKFYATQRLEIKRIGSIKKGENDIGNKVKVKVTKNKVAPPFKTANVEIYFGEGISSMAEILDFAVQYDIVDKAGSWFSYNNSKLGQGLEKTMENLRNNEELFNEIKEKVLFEFNSNK